MFILQFQVAPDVPQCKYE